MNDKLNILELKAVKRLFRVFSSIESFNLKINCNYDNFPIFFTSLIINKDQNVMSPFNIFL